VEQVRILVGLVQEVDERGSLQRQGKKTKRIIDKWEFRGGIDVPTRTAVLFCSSSLDPRLAELIRLELLASFAAAGLA
jgi:hypothetical protein